MNNTLALIKPDAMQKGFKDEIREDIMNNGFIIAEEKTLQDYLAELTEAGFREKEELVLKVVETDEP